MPTPDEVVDRMLRMAQVGPNDLVFDLGAGDGKIAIAAAKKFGARSVGIEYNPDMAKYAQGNVEKAGVTGKARIVNGDIFATDFTQATVITMYLLPALNLKLRPQILVDAPGNARGVAFLHHGRLGARRNLGHGRAPRLFLDRAGERQRRLGARQRPARRRRSPSTSASRKSTAPSTSATRRAGCASARLSGVNIGFAYVDGSGVRRDFAGRVTGGRMEGSFRTDNGSEGRWTRHEIRKVRLQLLVRPSQNGLFAVRLQPHSQTFCASVMVNFNGVNSVVLCEPSQNGWRLDCPQAHHQ